MKFKPGDTINYGGKLLRVRLAASVGFECDAKPIFYDLTDIKTGQHYCLPIIEVDEGQKAVYENGDWQVPVRIDEVTPATKVDGSSQTYWEQMGDKVQVSEEKKAEFADRVELAKEVQEESEELPTKKRSFVSTLANLWSNK